MTSRRAFHGLAAGSQIEHDPSRPSDVGLAALERLTDLEIVAGISDTDDERAVGLPLEVRLSGRGELRLHWRRFHHVSERIAERGEHGVDRGRELGACGRGAHSRNCRDECRVEEFDRAPQPAE